MKSIFSSIKSNTTNTVLLKPDLIESLAESEKDESQPSYVHNLYIFYKSCLDEGMNEMKFH